MRSRSGKMLTKNPISGSSSTSVLLDVVVPMHRSLLFA
jgi:hypothetical protein